MPEIDVLEGLSLGYLLSGLARYILHMSLEGPVTKITMQGEGCVSSDSTVVTLTLLQLGRSPP